MSESRNYCQKINNEKPVNINISFNISRKQVMQNLAEGKNSSNANYEHQTTRTDNASTTINIRRSSKHGNDTNFTKVRRKSAAYRASRTPELAQTDRAEYLGKQLDYIRPTQQLKRKKKVSLSSKRASLDCTAMTTSNNGNRMLSSAHNNMHDGLNIQPSEELLGDSKSALTHKRANTNALIKKPKKKKSSTAATASAYGIEPDTRMVPPFQHGNLKALLNRFAKDVVLSKKSLPASSHSKIGSVSASLTSRKHYSDKKKSRNSGSGAAGSYQHHRKKPSKNSTQNIRDSSLQCYQQSNTIASNHILSCKPSIIVKHDRHSEDTAYIRNKPLKWTERGREGLLDEEKFFYNRREFLQKLRNNFVKSGENSVLLSEVNQQKAENDAYEPSDKRGNRRTIVIKTDQSMDCIDQIHKIQTGNFQKNFFGDGQQQHLREQAARSTLHLVQTYIQLLKQDHNPQGIDSSNKYPQYLDERQLYSSQSLHSQQLSSSVVQNYHNHHHRQGHKLIPTRNHLQKADLQKAQKLVFSGKSLHSFDQNQKLCKSIESDNDEDEEDVDEEDVEGDVENNSQRNDEEQNSQEEEEDEQYETGQHLIGRNSPIITLVNQCEQQNNNDYNNNHLQQQQQQQQFHLQQQLMKQQLLQMQSQQQNKTQNQHFLSIKKPTTTNNHHHQQLLINSPDPLSFQLIEQTKSKMFEMQNLSDLKSISVVDGSDVNDNINNSQNKNNYFNEEDHLHNNNDNNSITITNNNNNKSITTNNNNSNQFNPIPYSSSNHPSTNSNSTKLQIFNQQLNKNEKAKLNELKRQQIEKWGYLLEYIKTNMNKVNTTVNVVESDLSSNNKQHIVNATNSNNNPPPHPPKNTQQILSEVYNFLQKAKIDLQSQQNLSHITTVVSKKISQKRLKQQHQHQQQLDEYKDQLQEFTDRYQSKQLQEKINQTQQEQLQQQFNKVKSNQLNGGGSGGNVNSGNMNIDSINNNLQKDEIIIDQQILQFKNDYSENGQLERGNGEQHRDLKLMSLETIECALKTRLCNLNVKKQREISTLEGQLYNGKLSEEDYQQQKQRINTWFKQEKNQIIKAKRNIWKGYSDAKGVLQKQSSSGLKNSRYFNDHDDYQSDQQNSTTTNNMMKCLSQSYLNKKKKPIMMYQIDYGSNRKKQLAAATATTTATTTAAVVIPVDKKTIDVIDIVQNNNNYNEHDNDVVNINKSVKQNGSQVSQQSQQQLQQEYKQNNNKNHDVVNSLRINDYEQEEEEIKQFENAVSSDNSISMNDSDRIIATPQPQPQSTVSHNQSSDERELRSQEELQRINEKLNRMKLEHHQNLNRVYIEGGGEGAARDISNILTINEFKAIGEDQDDQGNDQGNDQGDDEEYQGEDNENEDEEECSSTDALDNYANYTDHTDQMVDQSHLINPLSPNSLSYEEIEKDIVQDGEDEEVQNYGDQDQQDNQHTLDEDAVYDQLQRQRKDNRQLVLERELMPVALNSDEEEDFDQEGQQTSKQHFIPHGQKHELILTEDFSSDEEVRSEEEAKSFKVSKTSKASKPKKRDSSSKRKEKNQRRLKQMSEEDKEDVFQFLFLDLCIELYQEPCSDNRLMRSVSRFVEKEVAQSKKKKGVKTNINVVKDYLKRFCGYLIRTNRPALENLNVPMGPTAIQMLRYMHENDEDQDEGRQEEQGMVTLIVPIQSFDSFERSLLPTLEFEIFYEDQQKETERVNFLKNILHIHNKALFDALNEFLDQQRPFGIWGKPFPWKKASSFHHNYSELQLEVLFILLVKDRLKKGAQKVVQACSYVCGLLVDKEESLIGNGKLSEGYIEQIRQDRVARMLANDMLQNQERWVFYDDQETEVLVQTGLSIYNKLVKECVYELFQLINRQIT